MSKDMEKMNYYPQFNRAIENNIIYSFDKISFYKIYNLKRTMSVYDLPKRQINIYSIIACKYPASVNLTIDNIKIESMKFYFNNSYESDIFSKENQIKISKEINLANADSCMNLITIDSKVFIKQEDIIKNISH